MKPKQSDIIHTLKKLYRRHWYSTLIHLFLKCLSAKNQSIHPSSFPLIKSQLSQRVNQSYWMNKCQHVQYKTLYSTVIRQITTSSWFTRKGWESWIFTVSQSFFSHRLRLTEIFFSSPRSPGVFCTDSPYRFHIYFSEFWSDLKKILRLDGSFLHHRGHLKDDDVAIWFPVVSLSLCVSFS